MKILLQSSIATIIYILLFLVLGDYSYYQLLLPLVLALPPRFTDIRYSKAESILFTIFSILLTTLLSFITEQNTPAYFLEQAGWLSFLFMFLLLFPFGLKEKETEVSMPKRGFLDEITPQQTIAGGLAHEFNNHLMVLYGNIELLRHSPTEKHARYFDRLDTAFELSKKYTFQMLYYSGRSKISPILETRLSDLLSEIIMDNPLLETWNIDIENEHTFNIDKDQLAESFNLLLEKLSCEKPQIITIRDFKKDSKTIWLFDEKGPSGGLEVILPLPEGHPQTMQELFTPYHPKNIGAFRIGIPYAGEVLRQHFAAIGQSETHLHIVFPMTGSAHHLGPK